MDVADGGVVADGVTLVGIGKAAEDVPGRGDRKKKQKACDGLQRAPAPPLPRQDQVGNRRAHKKDGSNEAFCEQSQGHAGPRPVKAIGPVQLQSGDEAVEGNEQKQAQDGLGNDKACKEKRADGGKHAQPGVESGARPPCPAGPEPREPRQAEHGQRVGQVGGKGVLAEDAVADGHQPEGKRRFLDIADAIDLAGDPVAAVQDVLGRLRVRGVHIVHQRRREKRAKVHCGKDGSEEKPGGQRGRGGLRAVMRSCRVCHRG